MHVAGQMRLYVAYKLRKNSTVQDSQHDCCQLVAVCLVEFSARQKDWGAKPRHNTFPQARLHSPLQYLVPKHSFQGRQARAILGLRTAGVRTETSLDNPGYQGSWVLSGCIYSNPPSFPPFPFMFMVYFSQTAIAHFLSWTFLCNLLIALIN
jgi:hypothetical protein